jgi:hypothetical protein
MRSGTFVGFAHDAVQRCMTQDEQQCSRSKQDRGNCTGRLSQEHLKRFLLLPVTIAAGWP